jgi:hypothetical protein
MDVMIPELNFHIESAEPDLYAVAPHLVFKLRVGEEQPTDVRSVVLRAQVRLDPVGRRYTPREQSRLLELFGEPHRWGQTLRSLLWTHVTLTVPAFAGSTVVDLPVPCTSDFNFAVAKFFHALEEGEVPVGFLFSGTIFYITPPGLLQVSQISWEKEATFRLPVRVWQAMMDHHHPNAAWLLLRRDVFDRLYDYKCQQGVATWDQALDRLLAQPLPLPAEVAHGAD